MPEYLPVFNHGKTITLTAGATLTGGQLLTVNTDGTVSPATTASSKTVGVAGHDAATGDPVSVHAGGVHTLTATGAINAGATVESATAGTGATHTNGTNDVNIVGVALTSAAGGGQVRVMFQR